MASLVTELTVNVTSLSQLTASLNSAPRMSVGRVQFEFYFPLLMAVVIMLSGVVVTVVAWATGVKLFHGAVPHA